MSDEQILDLSAELRDLAHEVIAVTANPRALSLDELITVGGDLATVVEALRAVAREQGGTERWARRCARRIQRERLAQCQFPPPHPDHT